MKYWFKRKRFGYGWTPSTWQGWLIIGMYVALVLLGALFFTRDSAPESENALVFFTVLFVATSTLLAITHYTAPKAKWRWGKEPDDNPSEDY
jgi:hypothetical protein